MKYLAEITVVFDDNNDERAGVRATEMALGALETMAGAALEAMAGAYGDEAKLLGSRVYALDEVCR